MSTSELTQYLADAALQLPLAQRADLAHRLLASLQSNPSAAQPDEEYLASVAAEVERRSALVMKGEAKGRSAAEALAYLRDALANRRRS